MEFREKQSVYFVREDGTRTHGEFGEAWDGFASVFYKKDGRRFVKIVPLEQIYAQDENDNSQPQSRLAPREPDREYSFKKIFW